MNIMFLGLPVSHAPEAAAFSGPPAVRCQHLGYARRQKNCGPRTGTGCTEGTTRFSQGCTVPIWAQDAFPAIAPHTGRLNPHCKDDLQPRSE